MTLLFSRHPSQSSVDPLLSRTLGSFSQSWVISRLHIILLAAGIDPTGYSGHSFRRGAANSAAAAGISKNGIMELGRWKSDAVDRYFSASTAHSTRLALSQQLHSHPGPSTSMPTHLQASQAFSSAAPHFFDSSSSYQNRS